MKTIMPAGEVHKQYSEAVTAYRRLIPDPTLRMAVSRGMDEYMRRCALGVWQADSASGIQPEHVEYYNAIYTAGSPSPAALYWEVATSPRRSSTACASTTASTAPFWPAALLTH